MNIIIRLLVKYSFHFALLFFFISSNSLLFPTENKFKKIDSYNGLSQNTVNVLFEDKYGMIWVGTNNGLNRIDGNVINKFESNSVVELQHSKITDIKQTKDGLLISVYGVGVFKYIYSSDSFVSIGINYEKNQKLINTFEYDSTKKTIWVATSGGGVFSFDMNTGRKRNYFKEKDNKLKTSEINAIEIVGKSIYIGGENGNIISISLDQNKVNDLSYKSNSSILGLKKIGPKLFISSSEKNLIILDTETKKINEPKINFSNDTELKALREVCLLSDSTLLIPTFSGILKVNYRNDSLLLVKKYNNYNSNFSYNLFNTSLMDSRGKLWIGSNGDGLYYEDIFSTNLHVFKFDEIEQIPFNSVRAINSINNQLWVGGYGGIVIFNENLNPIKTINNKNNQSSDRYIPTDNVHSILLSNSRRDIVWLGTEGMGLIEYNIESGNFKKILNYNYKSEEYSLRNVFDIDYLDNTLILSTSEGLVSYNHKNKSFTNIELLNTLLEKESLKIKSTLLIDNLAYISILGSSPVIYNFDNGEIIEVKSELPKIIKNKVFNTNQVLPYKDGEIIIATNNYGLILFNLNTKEYRIFNESNGFLNNTINQAIVDKNNNIWCSTNIGLVRIDSNGTFSNYNNRKHELNKEYNTNASYLYHDSLFIFGATNGITIFNPYKISHSKSDANLIIMEVMVLTDNGIKIHNFVNNKSIIIDEKVNSIRINLIESENLFNIRAKYQYRINNSDWADFEGGIELNKLNKNVENKVEFRNSKNKENTIDFRIKYKYSNTYNYIVVLLLVLVITTIIIIFYIKRTNQKTYLDSENNELDIYSLFTDFSLPFIIFNNNLKIEYKNKCFETIFDNIKSDSLYSILEPDEIEYFNNQLSNRDYNFSTDCNFLNFSDPGKVAKMYVIGKHSNNYFAFIDLKNSDYITKATSEEIDRLFKVFIDTILEPLVITNWNGEIMFANKEAMKFLDINISNIPEVNLIKHLGLTSDNNLYKSILNAKDGLSFKNDRFELELNNEHHIIEGSGNRIDYLGRNLFILIFKNITPQIKLMNQLTESKINAERLSELKSLYISNLSHELKTPINAISGFTDILIVKSNNSSNNTYLHTIKTNTELLIQLIEDLLLYSKAETGKLLLRPVPTNINSLIVDLKNLFQLDFKNRNIHFTYDLNKSTINQPLNIDQLKLKQVLINIIGNSIKHTKNGIISLKVNMSKMFDNLVNLEIVIKDSGSGIPKDKLKEIFTAFSQVEDYDNKGTGLGLAISKKIIDSMGGEIKVNSKVNEGTEFTIIIDKINLVIPRKKENEYNNLNKEIIQEIFQEDNKLHVYSQETLVLAKSKLNGKLKSLREDIQTNFLLNDINQFAKEIDKLGVETNIDFIQNYSKLLISSTKSIEVEKINVILENFHKLEQMVCKLIEKNYG